MKLRKRKSNTDQGLDISPLIDMVFILLIFFMVTTTFNKDMKLELNRPKASSAMTASTKSIRLFIDRQQNIFLDGQPIRSWVIQSKLRELLRSSGQKAVLVVTDGKVSADRLVEVVDQCRLAGAEDVGVATEGEVGSS